MRPSFLLPGLLLALILGRVLVRAYTEVDDAFVDDWARAHGLTLTPSNRPMVRWYLHTARVLRTWGAVAGFLLPPLIAGAVGQEAIADTLSPLVFAGYLAGALYAELALVRPVAGRRVAMLVPRELGHYLPRRLIVAQRALGGLAVGAAVVTLFVGFERDGAAAAGGDGSARLTAAVLAGVAVLLAVLLEPVERWLVQRPQPFTVPDLVAADDAIRSQSVHSLAGSGIAVQLLCLAGGFVALSRSDLDALRRWMWVPAAACMVGALFTCFYYGHRAWRVRRAHPVPAAAP